MDPSPATRTTRGLGAVLRVPGSADLLLPALLRYSAADPHAVRLVLLLDAEGEGPDSVEWVFARSLLTSGVMSDVVRPAEGDGVQVRVEGRSVAVELAGAASVLLPLDGLVEFLTDSYTVVPTGQEGPVPAARELDDELTDLLDG